MQFNLLFSAQANNDIENLENDASLSKRLKAVKKTLGYLELNPKHPSLQTHKYRSHTGLNGEDVFEAYAQNNTPGAYRVFWCYGPKKGDITIIAITPHP